MAEATQEMIALAREIACEQWPSAHDFPEREAAEAAALAAIQATTERAAALNARQSGEGERATCANNARVGCEGDRLREALNVGEKFLNACFSAWSCGEPYHRVRTMTDRADEFRASLDSIAALRATDDAGGA